MLARTPALSHSGERSPGRNQPFSPSRSEHGGGASPSEGQISVMALQHGLAWGLSARGAPVGDSGGLVAAQKSDAALHALPPCPA